MTSKRTAAIRYRAARFVGWRAAAVRVLAILVLFTAVLPTSGWAAPGLGAASSASLFILDDPLTEQSEEHAGGTLFQHGVHCVCHTAVQSHAVVLPFRGAHLTASFAWPPDALSSSHPHLLPFKPPRA